VQPIDGVVIPEIAEEFGDLVIDAAKALRDQGVEPEDIQVLRAVDLRYRGQAYELTLPVPVGDLTVEVLSAMTVRFHDEHERVYGYRLDRHPIEIVNLRVTGTSRPPALPWPSFPFDEKVPSPVGMRRVLHESAGTAADWPVYRFTEIPAGAGIEGPAIVEYPGSTCVILPGWTARWDAWRHAHIVKSDN